MADCSNCKSHKKEPETVSYIVYESEMARAERRDKRNTWIFVLLIALLVGTNGAWLYHESQFEDVTTTYEAIADDGGNAIANGSGEVNYNG